MTKEPQMTRPNTRYNPYPSSRPARPRRESPPPENWGNQARSHHHQLTIRIYAFLDDLHLLHADRHLCEIFREHAKQPGPLGEAIRTWVEYVDDREGRQPEPSALLETQHNNQSHRGDVSEPIPGGEDRPSQLPVDQPGSPSVPPPHQSHEYPDVPTTSDENYLQHSPRPQIFTSTSPGETFFAGAWTQTPPPSRTLPYPHPGPTTSPYEDSSQLWPWWLPEAAEDIQPQGEEHHYPGGSPPPLPASHPPEVPLLTSPHYTPSRRTGDEGDHNRRLRFASPSRSHEGHPSRRPRRSQTPWSSPQVTPLGSPQVEESDEAVLHWLQATEVDDDYDVAQRHQRHRDGALWRPQTHDGHSDWPDRSLVDGHHEQDDNSHQGSEESVHADFWATAGWTPEGESPWREEGPSIPSYLKGKGRAYLQGPNEGGATPGEQDSSRCVPPQPGSPANADPCLERTASPIYRESVFLGTPIKVESPDPDSFLAALRETPTRSRAQTPLEAPSQAAPSLPPTATGQFDPQPPPSEDAPARHASSSSRPQRKRKRGVIAGEGSEEEPRAQKRPRKARVETLAERQQRDAREGREDEHEQPSAQLQPRRSARIRAINNQQDVGLPKVGIPAKSTSLKRVVRKK